MTNSIVYWRGKSRINGETIVLYLTFDSANSGTGSMVQTWIMVDKVDPVNASRQNLDVAVCGDCPLKGNAHKGRSCYVNLMMGPNSVHRALSGQPVYSDVKALKSRLTGRRIRIGAYGDPAAVPIAVWNRLIAMTSGHTGYAHQWKQAKNQSYRSIVMASVETETEQAKAASMGWRTFRVRQATDRVLPGEIICPKSPEGGHKEQCITCMACNGYKRAGQRNVVIVQHGSKAILSNFERLRENVLTLATVEVE